MFTKKNHAHALSSFFSRIYYILFLLSAAPRGYWGMFVVRLRYPAGAAGVYKMGPLHDADESDKSAPEAGPSTTQRSGQSLGDRLGGVRAEDNLFVEAVGSDGSIYHGGGGILLGCTEVTDQYFG